MKGLTGFSSLFGQITADQLREIEARRVDYERKISDFQKRPTEDSETETAKDAK